MASWALWSAPAAVIGYVLVVDVLAIVTTIVALPGLTVPAATWVQCAIIAIGSAVHIESGRDIERLRWAASEGATYANLKSMWFIAAVLLLPLPLAAVIVVSSFAHSGIRLRRSLPHRVTFSAATVVLAAGAAAVCLALIDPGPNVGDGPLGLVAVVCAAVLFWFVNYALVVGAVLLSNPDVPGRTALGRLSDQFVVFGALGLGIATAVLLTYRPWLTLVLLVTVLGLQRSLLVAQFQAAARTDQATGVANSVFWTELAGKELERAVRGDTALSVLYLDLDHFKTVNDTHGHLAGDQVLKAVAAELKHELRTGDLIGRLGGEEFAVLLPATGATDAASTAERIRRRIAALAVDVTTSSGPAVVADVTCSLGTATYPDAGRTLPELQLAADSALYAAKSAGRDQVVVAPAVTN